METSAPHLRRGDQFMARGQRHTIKHVQRISEADGVYVSGERADGQFFEAEFKWDDTVDTVSSTL